MPYKIIYCCYRTVEKPRPINSAKCPEHDFKTARVQPNTEATIQKREEYYHRNNLKGWKLT